MSKVNIYEIFNAFEAAPTKEAKKDVLRKYDGPVLRNVLQGAFHPAINYVIKTKPNFLRSVVPPGMAYSNMTDAMDKIYIFVEGSKRVNPNLRFERKVQILIQILEGLEAGEADVYMNMILKNLQVKGLTYKVVQEVFPGLLPD